MTIHKATPKRDDVIALLAAEKLPVDDLPETLDNFVVATDGETLTGVAGLEIYGQYGLLRSLAVDKAYRDKGIANNLLAQIEGLAKTEKLSAIYLLTETAPDYFFRKGYRVINRSSVPSEVQQSTEFSHVCPVSAIVMKKPIQL